MRPCRVLSLGWSSKNSQQADHSQNLSWSWRGLQGRRSFPKASFRPGSVVQNSSDSLVFVASLMTFCRCRLGLQGLPALALPYNQGRSYGPTFYTFISPSECDSIRADRSTSASLLSPCNLLSEDSRRLSADISHLASTPNKPRFVFGSQQPSRPHVPPLWFLTTSTVYSASEPWVYCASQPARGSLRFCSPQSADQHFMSENMSWPANPIPEGLKLIKPAEANLIGRSESLPAAPFTPLEEYRSLAAALCHHSRCPLDVTALA